MHAQHLQDGIIAVTGTVREERFTRIWAGIGWPDRDAGYLCVVGEREDGRYHVLSEFLGGLSELGRAAIEAKDRLLVENVWVDGRDAVATSYLRTLDGLCAPPVVKADSFPNSPFAKADNLPDCPFAKRDNLLNPAFAKAHNLNPPFAKANNLFPPFDKGGYGGILHDQHTAIVVAVPDRIIGNFRSALEKTRGVIMAGQPPDSRNPLPEAHLHSPPAIGRDPAIACDEGPGVGNHRSGRPQGKRHAAGGKARAVVRQPAS